MAELVKYTQPWFVQTHYPYAKQIETRYKIPALYVLTQAGLESGWGKKAPGNMFFGKKAKKDSAGKPIGKAQLLTTREILKTPNAKFPEIISVKNLGNGKWEYKVKDWFVAYDTPADGFEDWAKLITTSNRYKGAMQYVNNYPAFITYIAKGGYATDPNYSKALVATYKNVQSAFDQVKDFIKDNAASVSGGGGLLLLIAGFFLIRSIRKRNKNKQ